MKRRNPVYVVGRILAIPIFKLLYFYRVRGKKNVPKKGPFIVCSNHLSNLDPVMLSLTQKRQIYYMAKAELFKNKFASFIIRMLGAFPVNRGAGDGKAINEAEQILKDGRLVGIFIEGTRSKTGDFLRPKAGAAMIAHQMNVPVIPVCITPRKKKVKMFSGMTISWGNPLTTEELGLKKGSGEEYRNASRIIMDEIKKLREESYKKKSVDSE